MMHRVICFTEWHGTGHTRPMGELSQKIVRDIDAAKCWEDIKDWIWVAGDLIRKAANPEYCSGFEDIDREQVTWSERLDLKEAVLRALERSSEPIWVFAMLGVLGCTCDHDLKKLYIEYLTKELSVLKQANHSVYVLLLALRDIGESVFEGARSLAVIDVAKNMAEADKYLRSKKITIPG